ncbi:UDP-N-acetyl-D-galactosamine dehydrogenase [Amphibacillus marinus]|uniref:UDP-N-acetyl-D-galactosamine dehydrogenase n=1 Tax=Amphibacillus marinus TaxID=872970 RepID=A0A1H8R9C5_9BACI|nr:nucleotide sugar dehydrogenase [Amphibacillus marinus]SEO63030.1 UDP-N-acetyl-D-galactosamine dehydrogenase [Amphibacillus marinus]
MGDRDKLQDSRPVVGMVGLGYVGLPAIIAFAEKYQAIGYDCNPQKIASLKNGIDYTNEVGDEAVIQTSCQFVNSPALLNRCDYIIIAVPTPINAAQQPDLNYLEEASIEVGKHMKRGAIVIYESTVFPGATEEICLPLLEKNSGLEVGKAFSIGYSPERINPGDKENTFKTISKIVSGYDLATAQAVEALYQSVLDAPVFVANSIKVAEAAKVVENTQRDINIAYMNELSQIFQHLGIDTQEVIEAASTKWNFISLNPGLVGGHCISVDPYYLIWKAEQVGYNPYLIKKARQINEYMVTIVANQVFSFAANNQIELSDLHVNILGVAFKENVGDLRNAKAIEVIKKLQERNVRLSICDPLIDDQELEKLTGERNQTVASLPAADIVMLISPHQQLVSAIEESFQSLCKNEHTLFIDLKGCMKQFASQQYWTL